MLEELAEDARQHPYGSEVAGSVVDLGELVMF